jgi:hypothetical protein
VFVYLGISAVGLGLLLLALALRRKLGGRRWLLFWVLGTTGGVIVGFGCSSALFVEWRTNRGRGASPLAGLFSFYSSTEAAERQFEHTAPGKRMEDTLLPVGARLPPLFPQAVNAPPPPPLVPAGRKLLVLDLWASW